MYDYIEDEVKDEGHLMALVLNGLPEKGTFLTYPFAKVFEASVNDCLVECDRDVFCPFLLKSSCNLTDSAKTINSVKRVMGVEFSEDGKNFVINPDDFKEYIKDLAYNNRITGACENLSKQIAASSDLYLREKAESLGQ